MSTGRNWGLGSALPVRDDAVIADLSGLNRIRHLDLETGVAVVEAGVTQGQLAERVAGTPYMLNVTASASATSVLGNAMDRGIGLYRQRVDDLLGLEVVMADGSLVRVGRWPDGTHAAAAGGFLPGPGLTQIFVQSNFGVATAAVISLLPRPSAQRVVRLRFPTEGLAEAMRGLCALHADQVPTGVLKVFSDGASAAYGSSGVPGYTAYVPVAGARNVITALIDEVRARAVSAGFGNEVTVLDLDSGTTVAERALLRALKGDPSASDEMLFSVFGTSADGVDSQRHKGWLFCAPTVPMTAADACRAVALLDDTVAALGFRVEDLTIGHTLNLLPNRWIDFVISIRFPCEAEVAARAHKLLDRLHERFAAAGFPPYRLDIDHMALAVGLRGDPGQENLLNQLKQTLDPTNLIAPGRYV